MTYDQKIISDEELALFQIVGHSYDLDTENMWDTIESIFKTISTQDDILPMTTIEIVDYLKAMGNAKITDSHIINNSDKSLYFSVNGTICEVNPASLLNVINR